MLKANDFRLDWWREFGNLDLYLKEVGGVVILQYASEDAAPDKFNHLLKEAFCNPRNGRRLSLRIDHDWFTTRHTSGVLDEIDRLLQSVGIKVELPTESFPDIRIMTDLEAGGPITNSINGLHINPISGYSGRALRERAAAVFAALKQYAAGGGRFMVVLNDMQQEEQAEFWQQVWHAGLAEAGGEDMLLVVHAGKKSSQELHRDCPPPNLHLVLPTSIEEDSDRDNHFLDDLIDVFSQFGFDEACTLAGVHLGNNRDSILNINVKLSTAIMSAKKSMARRKE